MWQVSGRSNTTYAERVRLDTYYVKNWTLWQDVSILARTVPAVISGRGAGSVRSESFLLRDYGNHSLF